MKYTKQELHPSLVQEIETYVQQVPEVLALLQALGVDLSAIGIDVGGLNTNMTAVKTDVSAVKTDTGTVKTDVASVKTTVGTVNTNVNTVNTNIGTPNTAANNATTANLHSKINWLLANLLNVTTEDKYGIAVFTATGTFTFTVPPGVRKFWITGIGGGGGAVINAAGTWGGAGGLVYRLPITIPKNTSTISVTVGAAGINHASAPTSGGNTIFGSYATMLGGVRGYSQSNGSSGYVTFRLYDPATDASTGTIVNQSAFTMASALLIPGLMYGIEGVADGGGFYFGTLVQHVIYIHL